jgi:hypothetical protein
LSGVRGGGRRLSRFERVMGMQAEAPEVSIQHQGGNYFRRQPYTAEAVVGRHLDGSELSAAQFVRSSPLSGDHAEIRLVDASPHKMRIPKSGRKQTLSIRAVGTRLAIWFSCLRMRLFLRRRGAPDATEQFLLDILAAHLQNLLQELVKSGCGVRWRVLSLYSSHFYLSSSRGLMQKSVVCANLPRRGRYGDSASIRLERRRQIPDGRGFSYVLRYLSRDRKESPS